LIFVERLTRGLRPGLYSVAGTQLDGRLLSKNLSLGINQEYNSFIMCFRISTSSASSRVTNGLLILLAAFLLGFFAIRLISSLYP